jgi:RNA polymerase nonessential primary-like sigma factor
VVLRALRHLETHAPPGGKDPSLEDVAHLLGKQVADVERLLRHQEHMLSLDAPLDRESGLTIADGIADDDARAPELLLHDSAIEASVAGWLAELNPRQRMVIERRYGLNACEVTTLEDLAAELGVTRERVRQIQGEALDKLRAKLTRRGFTKDALF